MNMKTKKSMITFVVCGLLALLMALMAISPVTAQAAEKTSFKKLKEGTWTTNETQFYKITVPKDGELYFQVRKKQSDIPGSGGLYTVKEDAASKVTPGQKYKGGWAPLSIVNDRVAVKKGTYYLRVDGGTLKYKFTAAGNQKNKTKKKAISLRADKTAKAIMLPKMNYDRWYKITISKKQKIEIETNLYYTVLDDVTVYNSDGQKVAMTKGDKNGVSCSKKALPKGTYYIKLDKRYIDAVNKPFGPVVLLTWR